MATAEAFTDINSPAPGKAGLDSPWVKGTVSLSFRHLEDTILGPLLDALNVEATEALSTIPYLLEKNLSSFCF